MQPPAWLHVDWSRYERIVAAGGAQVNLVDTGGDGPAIVFLHGHSASWQHWLAQIPEFMGDHRVVAVDHPGFGISPMETGEITITRYAQVVDAVMEELGIDSACVVGNSMGGFIGAELASRFPARVERLVLVSAAGLADRYVGIPIEYLGHDRAGAVVETLFGNGSLSEAFARSTAARPRARKLALGWIVSHPEDIHPALAYEILRDLGRPAGPAALRACVTYPEFHDILGEVGCPTLVVWGEDDRIVHHTSAAAYEAAIAGARVVVYPDTGHLPMCERPERFNADLRNFMGEPATVRSGAVEAG